jgi:vacuolar iron transporter family protein
MEDALARWRSEKTASYLSSTVAVSEPEPARAALFRQMADAAEEQAGILAKELPAVPPFTPSLRSRLTVWLIGVFGPRTMRPVLSASKVRGVSVYRGKLEPEGHPWPTSADEVGRRHKSLGGGTLRAGIFGVNDGLVSNTCLVMGVAGAAVEPSVLVLTGVAGLLAGAFSMAAGEYVSMLSPKEMFEHQIAQEKDELERYPKEEAEELALIYAARGIPLKEARDVAAHLIANPDKALDTLAREERSARRPARRYPPSSRFRSARASPSFPSCSSCRTVSSSPLPFQALPCSWSARCSACSRGAAPLSVARACC